MYRVAVKYFGSAILALCVATVGDAQQPSDQYAEQVRKADAWGVAITFLEHERQRISIDLVRNHKNATLIVGGQTVTQENVNSFAEENEWKLRILSDEMKRRGFSMAAGEYIVQTYVAREDDRFRACAAPQDSFGPVTVVQDGSTIEFRDLAGKLSGYGVIVGASIAVVPGARDQVSPRAIIGVLQGKAMALSMYDRSPMVLKPGAQPSICRLGVASKLEGPAQTK